MIAFCHEKHKLYQKEFNHYLLTEEQDKKLIRSFKNEAKRICSYNSDICNLWIFESDVKSTTANESTKSFVVIPSLFNSPEILFFDQQDNFIKYLKQFGNVYLVEWVSSVKSLNLSDYTYALVEIIDFIKINTSNNPNLIGHCIGGNIAIFASLISKKVHSLTMLTTPWDYSHFSAPIFLAERLRLNQAISGLETVPKIYIQMLFFMLFPENYQIKLNKYFALNTSKAKEKYLKIEKWLQSGISISTSLYEEILEMLVMRNSLVNNNFCINDTKISLEQINVPSFIVSAKQDKIAPPSSIEPLKNGLKNSTTLSVKGGHISYLINNDNNFKSKYAQWLQEVSKLK